MSSGASSSEYGNSDDMVVEIFIWQLVSPHVILLAPTSFQHKIALRKFNGRWFEYKKLPIILEHACGEHPCDFDTCIPIPILIYDCHVNMPQIISEQAWSSIVVGIEMCIAYVEVLCLIKTFKSFVVRICMNEGSHVIALAILKLTWEDSTFIFTELAAHLASDCIISQPIMQLCTWIEKNTPWHPLAQMVAKNLSQRVNQLSAKPLLMDLDGLLRATFQLSPPPSSCIMSA